jgi:hypothetical protein
VNSWRDRDEAWTAVVRELRELVAAATTAAMPPSNLPPRREFVGRTKELQALDDALRRDGRAAITQGSLWGLGGVGKTALALEYAHRALEGGAYPGGVWWVHAEGRPLDAMVQLAGSMRRHAPVALKAVREITQPATAPGPFPASSGLRSAQAMPVLSVRAPHGTCSTNAPYRARSEPAQRARAASPRSEPAQRARAASPRSEPAQRARAASPRSGLAEQAGHDEVSDGRGAEALLHRALEPRHGPEGGGPSARAVLERSADVAVEPRAIGPERDEVGQGERCHTCPSTRARLKLRESDNFVRPVGGGGACLGHAGRHATRGGVSASATRGVVVARLFREARFASLAPRAVRGVGAARAMRGGG